MQRNIELKIAEDLCPSCSHVIEVFVPQPYASGPELLELLSALMDWYGDGEDLGDDWEHTDTLMARARAAIAKAKGEANG